ncbi:hypothetical protein HDU98_002313 [Podochytrium sp. JEL0797]|nr:hypothetical protein HDU98_002313 [Podochytrium sp. JEL0797]
MIQTEHEPPDIQTILTEHEIRALFARPNPPKTAILKRVCKKAKDVDGRDIWVLK